MGQDGEMENQLELAPARAANDSQTDYDLAEVPLSALSQKSRLILSKMLNIPRILPTEDNLPRDWRGIAYLVGLGGYRTDLSCHPDPTAKALQLWNTEEYRKTATFHQLLTFLGRIDRWDVADDIYESLVEDAANFKSSKRRPSNQRATEPTKKDIYGKDDNILTHDDVQRSHEGLPPQLYDAFVLFADEDIDFATELIERMENFGFKLCVRERDLIGGVSFEHEAILRLISERCNRLIVIVSPAFLQSSANAFFVNFAQALGIEQGRRKIVPCLYQHCILPPTLNFYFLLNYQRAGRLWNFWDKLKDSIRTTPAEGSIAVPKITITEVDTPKTTTPKAAAIMESTNIAPVKAPRKKRGNSPIANGVASTAPAMANPQIQTTAVAPAPSHIRNSYSTVNLREMHVPLTNSVCDISSSSMALHTAPASTYSKKTKWYEKFLKTSPVGLMEPNNSAKPAKRKWFRKKVAVSS